MSTADEDDDVHPFADEWIRDLGYFSTFYCSECGELVDPGEDCCDGADVIEEAGDEGYMRAMALAEPYTGPLIPEDPGLRRAGMMRPSVWRPNDAYRPSPAGGHPLRGRTTAAAGVALGHEAVGHRGPSSPPLASLLVSDGHRATVWRVVRARASLPVRGPQPGWAGMDLAEHTTCPGGDPMNTTDTRCPTHPACVLAGDQHDDWRHSDAEGNEWPVTAAEVNEAMVAAEAAHRGRPALTDPEETP